MNVVINNVSLCLLKVNYINFKKKIIYQKFYLIVLPNN